MVNKVRPSEYPYAVKIRLFELFFGSEFFNSLFEQTVESSRIFKHNEMTDSRHEHYFEGWRMLSGSLKIERAIDRIDTPYTGTFIFSNVPGKS